MQAEVVDSSNLPWYKTLTGYQWFVFIVCCLAWDMDCTDQQLFNLARRPAMVDLVPPVESSDARLPGLKRQLEEKAAESGKTAPTDAAVKTALRDGDIGAAATLATSIFML